MDESSDTQEVAPRHRFNADRLDRYLASTMSDFGSGRFEVSQFKGGTSNPTFLIAKGARRYVLRKKPPGELLASAHQVEREFTAMRALQGVIPVPTVRHLCTDNAIIGTTFYVMDYLDGRIFRDASLPGLSKADRSAIYDEMNLTLAKLHSVSPDAIGLGGFGREGDYFQRQIGRWSRQYRAAQTETIPEMDELIERLPQAAPRQERVSVVHGDYRLENLMFHPREPRLIAVLDWELSTLGDPLADVGYSVYLWHSLSARWGSLSGVDLAASGIPNQQQYIDAYCRRTGRSHIEHVPFYLSFSIFRLAAISQGGYLRGLNGVLANPAAAQNETPALAKLALSILLRT